MLQYWYVTTFTSGKRRKPEVRQDAKHTNARTAYGEWGASHGTSRQSAEISLLPSSNETQI